MGYAQIAQKGTGLHLRTFARSFIIDDGEQRFVFVSVESAMIGHDVRSAVGQFINLCWKAIIAGTSHVSYF